MKAIQIQSPGNVAVVDVEKTALKSGEVLLKLGYVGFCGSDLNTFRGGNAMVTFPRIPGHEI
ncbi:MAG: alcohol dehydrogenase catalytic domain-containing protein, partial [Bacteroidales bacterium]|nr:alcohol dehydrogenase catalytic domain-containing protein [Bacteroidales bacterium]